MLSFSERAERALPRDRMTAEVAAEASGANPAQLQSEVNRLMAAALARARAYPDWIGYLSTTGVYGDRQGRWVDETSPCNARSLEGARRVSAERDWFQVGRGMGLTVSVFRPVASVP